MTLVAMIGGGMILLALLYSGVLLVALSGLSRHATAISRTLRENPRISVIIPVRNEETRILSCLQSVEAQDYPANQFEVLISDDFSDDRTLEVVDRYISSHPRLSWSVIKGDPVDGYPTGKKGALQRAIDLASGVLIMTTDADTLHHREWISAMVSSHCETGAKMILGPVMFSGEKNPFQKIQTLEFLGIMGLTAGFARLGHAVMCNGANLCYEKGLFYEVGGFDGNQQFHSGDDQFLLGKVKKEFGGHSIYFLFDDRAIVTTDPSQNLRSFFQQRLRWISKSRGYSDLTVLFTGIVTYMFQAAIVAGFILGLSSLHYPILAVGLLCVKVAVDFPLVYSMSRFFRKQHLWKWYIPAQLFQVLYVAVSVPMAFLIPVRWKGRKG